MYTKISFKSKLSFQRIFACFNNFSVLTPILFLIIFLFNSCSTAAAEQTGADGKDDLEVEIQSDKTNFIEGESIDLLTTVGNNSDKPITIGYPDEFLYDYTNDSLYSVSTETGSLKLAPNKNYSFFINPNYILQTIQPGEYDYYISYKISPNKYTSNKIHIKITPLPDSLKSEYKDLKNQSGGYLENARLLYEKNRGSFFEQRFNSKYLSYPANLKEIMGLRANQYEDYILKYPDNVKAWFFLRNMINKMSDNQDLVERIITRLQKQKPNCKLLTVLHNQPDYITNKIKHILN